MTDTGSIFQIQVTLEETEHPIWRRFQTQAYESLHKLHLTLQTVMGLTDSHLYMFRKAWPIYEDDFVDSWEHEILIEKILSAEPGRTYPICLDGGRLLPSRGLWWHVWMRRLSRSSR